MYGYPTEVRITYIEGVRTHVYNKNQTEARLCKLGDSASERTLNIIDNKFIDRQRATLATRMANKNKYASEAIECLGKQDDHFWLPAMHWHLM
jgi:hypothetical protein